MIANRTSITFLPTAAAHRIDCTTVTATTPTTTRMTTTDTDHTNAASTTSRSRFLQRLWGQWHPPRHRSSVEKVEKSWWSFCRPFFIWPQKQPRRRLNNKHQNMTPLLSIFLMLLVLPNPGHGLRCYTDVSATKSLSVECGLNTGCVKIYIDTEEMLMRRQAQYGYGYGYDKPEGVPPLPDRYLNNPVLRRGCFVIAVPDRCYTAKSGLSYCWCSQKDLCNEAISWKVTSGFHMYKMIAVFAAVSALADVFMQRILLRTTNL